MKKENEQALSRQFILWLSVTSVFLLGYAVAGGISAALGKPHWLQFWGGLVGGIVTGGAALALNKRDETE